MPKDAKVAPDIPSTQNLISLSDYLAEIQGFHYYNREDSVLSYTGPDRVNCGNRYSLRLRTQTVTKMVKEKGGDTLKTIARINYVFGIDTENRTPRGTKIKSSTYTSKAGKSTSYKQKTIQSVAKKNDENPIVAKKTTFSSETYITRLYTELNAFISGRRSLDSTLALFDNNGTGVTVRVSHCNNTNLDTSFNSVEDYLRHFNELGYGSMSFNTSLLDDSVLIITPDCYEKNCVFTVPVEQEFTSHKQNGKFMYGDKTLKEIQLIRYPNGEVFIGNIEVLETKGCIKQ